MGRIKEGVGRLQEGGQKGLTAGPATKPGSKRERLKVRILATRLLQQAKENSRDLNKTGCEGNKRGGGDTEMHGSMLFNLVTRHGEQGTEKCHT